ncbi:MAG TPA: hypothetical protein EYG03_30260 [Planctomycetes bacterium]|nr:hypothetical protein [Fuerstiella sp.]HIK96248.1 hypothetical protein [Planctomycetota bacterium]
MKDGFFELNQSLILDTTWQVMSVDAKGDADIIVTIDRVQFRADGKGAAAIISNLRFDSKDEKEPLSRPEKGVFGVLKAFVDSPIAVTINEQGSVKHFDLSEALTANLNNNNTRELAGFFGDIFTAQGVRHRLTSWLVVLPKDPVSTGDKWRQELPSRGGKPIVSVYSCDYAGPVVRDGHTVAKINVKPEVKAQGDGAKKRGEKIIEQHGEGGVYFDDRTRRILEVVLKHHVVLESFAKTTLDTRTTIKLRPQPSR